MGVFDRLEGKLKGRIRSEVESRKGKEGGENRN